MTPALLYVGLCAASLILGALVFFPGIAAAMAMQWGGDVREVAA